jgi:uncharacterized repeat protein (TIGR01451 family)
MNLRSARSTYARMKTLSFFKKLALLVFGLTLISAPARGQAVFAFSAQPSVESLAVSNSVTYTFSVTNAAGVLQMLVTNSFSGPVEFQGTNVILNAGANQISVTTNGNTLIYDLNGFSGVVQASLTVAPLAAGSLTNSITAAAPVAGVTNAASTNIVVLVTNTSYTADLRLSMAGPATNLTILPGDTFSYTMISTNMGPAGVPDVLLTNNLPAGVRFISASPAYSPVIISGAVVFDIGTLTNGGSSSVTLNVASTNSGILQFTSSIGATNLIDANLTNNSASVNIRVSVPATNQIIATNLTDKTTFNFQTGLMEQKVRLWNVSSNNANSVRLTISGLTNWLYNASGTNNGNPYVVYAAPLNTNQSADLVLELFVPTRLPITVPDSNYTAVAISAPSLSVTNLTNVVFTVSSPVVLSNGNILIEFPSVPNASYTVIYSTNSAFSNPLKAVPNIIAPADRVQWIDDGPPKTISRPINSTSRFYKVIKN